MKYVGLTDNPEERKRAHGSPPDWQQRKFLSEIEARSWEKEMLKRPGFRGAPSGKGWKYGYIYTITSSTIEEDKRDTDNTGPRMR